MGFIRHSTRVVALAIAASAAPASATNLNVVVRSGGQSAITVDVGATVNYEITGELSDALNEGLALFLLDVSFSGGPLAAADTPTDPPMSNFVRPEGITNPDGYGGTVIDGVLVQLGGAQNTIKNNLKNAAFPIGTVITGVASPGNPVVLATGSFTAPGTAGEYTLSVTSIAASVIREGEDGTGSFWAVDLAGAGAITNLTVTTEVPTSDDPTIAAIGPRYLSIHPGVGETPVGLLVTPDCLGGTGKYVGLPDGPHNIARLVDNPNDAAFLLPSMWGNPVRLTGTEIIPSTGYILEADIGFPGSPQLLPPVSATTWVWGNVDNTSIVEIADILCLLQAYSDNYTTCSLFATDLAGDDPDQLVEVTDILAGLSAYAGGVYGGSSPCP